MSYERFPLTQPQQRIWMSQMLHPKSKMYNIGGWVKINGKIDKNILCDAIRQCVLSHDSFKIQITVDKGIPYQYFNENPNLSISEIDLSTQQGLTFDEWISQRFNRLFVLENNPLFDFTVIRFSDDSYGYCIRMHHLIADGWSFYLLNHEIMKNYQSRKLNIQPNFKGMNQYKDFITQEKEYLCSEKYVKDKEFWKNEFDPLPDKITVPRDKLDALRESLYISQKTKEYLVCFCKNAGITLNSFFVTLFLLFLYKTTTYDEVVINLPTLGRKGRAQRQVIGMFVSTMPFRFKFQKNESIYEMLLRVHTQIRYYHAHNRYPYNHLLKDLHVHSLYTSCVNYYNTEFADEFCGIPAEYHEYFSGEQEYDFQIIIRDWNDHETMRLDIDFKPSIINTESSRDILYRLQILIDQMIEHNSRQINKCVLTDEEELNQFREYNLSNIASNTRISTVLELINQQMEETPLRIAVQSDECQYTYDDLNWMSEAVALVLRQKGVQRGSIVGLYSRPSPNSVIGILGIWKAGAAYLPLDPRLPSERIANILGDAQSEVVLTDTMFDKEIQYSGAVIYIAECISRHCKKILSKTKSENFEPGLWAYIIYTSGSTGKPKGVLNSHQSLSQYIIWAKSQYISDQEEIFPLFTSLSFDLTITSLFTPLISGGSIRVYNEDDNQGPSILHQIIQENICTIIKLTPSHLEILKDIEIRNSRIKKLIVGGEQLYTKLAKDVLSNFGHQVIIYNEYGPTEATVGCMIHVFNPEIDLSNAVPIGKPADFSSIWVLDRDRQPVPMGWSGELYVAGKSIVEGYLNQPLLTANRFIRDASMGIVYRTGDKARFITKDCIEFIGRTDRQIEFLGHRIELEEIEFCINSILGITRSAVCVVYKQECKILCLFYTSDTLIDENCIKRHLIKNLPTYMHPTIFIHMDALPTTVNGKIDYKMLGSYELHTSIEMLEFPQRKEESILADELGDLLGSSVNRKDNFYYIGGDSIKAIQLASRLTEKGYKIKVKDILAHPVIFEMADYLISDTLAVEYEIAEQSFSAPPIFKWFSEKHFDHPELYCQCVALELKHAWTKEALQMIIAILLEYHNAFRLRYNLDSQNLYYCKAADLKEKYLISMNMKENSLSWDAIFNKLTEDIDLSNGPIVKFAVLQRTSGNDILVIVIHHIAVDGVSWHILLDDIQTLMEQYLSGKTLLLPPKTSPYSFWVISQQKKMYFQQDAEFYQNLLSIQEMPCRKETSQKQSLIKSSLDTDNTRFLLQDANLPYATKPEELILDSFLRGFSIVTSRQQIVVELEGHGRNNDDLDLTRTVGWFTNLYPALFTINERDIDLSIQQTKETIRSIPNKGEGFGYLSMPTSKWDGESNWIRFNYLGELSAEEKYFTVHIPEITFFNPLIPITCLLEINVFVKDGKLYFLLAFDNERWSDDICNQIINNWHEQMTQCLDLCRRRKNERIWTPTDFGASGLTDQDLSVLFRD